MNPVSPDSKKQKRSFPRIFLRLLLAILLVLATGIVFLLIRPISLNLDRFKDTIAHQVGSALHREVLIEGDIVLRTGIVPAVQLSEVSIGNPAEWERESPFITLRSLETAIGLSELIKGKINIDNISIRGITLSLETNKDGIGNWEGFAATEEKTPGEPAPEEEGEVNLEFTELGSLTIEELVVLQRRHDSPIEKEFRLDRLHGSAKLDQGIDLDLEGTFLDLPYRGKLRGGTLTALRERSEAWPVEISGKLGNSSIHLEGQFSARDFSIPGVIRFDLDVPDLEELIPITGDLPDIGSFQLAGEARRTSRDQFQISNLKGALREAPVSGSFDLDLSGEKPRLDGNLDIAFLDPKIFRREKDGTTETEETAVSSEEPATVPEEDAAASDSEEGRKKIILPLVGNLRLHIGELKAAIEAMVVKNLNFEIGVEEETAFAEVALLFGETPLHGRLDLERKPKESLSFDLVLDGRSAELTDIIAFYTGHNRFEGRFEHLRYAINGTGETLVDAWHQRAVDLDITNAEMLFRGNAIEKRFFVEKGSMSRDGPKPGALSLAGNIGEAPFELEMEFSLKDTQRVRSSRIHSIEGTVADARLHVESEEGQKFNFENARFSFSLKGDNLAMLDTVYELDLPPLGPYSVSGEFEKIGDLLEIPQATVKVGSSQVAGSCRLDPSGKRPSLTLELNAKTLQLDDFASKNWSAFKSGSADETPDRGRPAAEIPGIFSYKALNKFNVESTVRVGEVLSGRDHLGNGNLKASVRGGKLSIHPLTLGIPGGSFSGKFSFQPMKDNTLDWAAQVGAQSFELGVLIRRFKPDTDISALANVKLDVSAGGVPYGAPQLKAATGTLDLEVCPRNMGARVLDLWATNLVMAILPRLDPKNKSELNCILARLRLQDGVILPVALGMDTTTIRVSAEGQIDLAGNELDLILTPVPKRPQLFSLELPLRMKGPLNDPNVTMGKLPLARTTGRMAKNTLLFPAKLIAGERPPADGSDICPCTGAGTEQ